MPGVGGRRGTGEDVEKRHFAMTPLKLYIATSLDGYIATADGSVEWLDAYQSDEEDYGYHRFYDSVDTLLMGGNTYRAILGFGCDWPYAGKQTWVLSRSIQAATSGQFGIISRDTLTFVRQLKSLETGKDIWLVGGGEIISLLLAENLIDEMLLCIFPVMLGNGIPLFPPSSALSKWQLEEQRSFPSGATMLTYKLS